MNDLVAPGIGLRIRAARANLGLTQESLAERLRAAGVACEGRGTVSAWEKERNAIPLPAVAWLCKHSGISADALLFDSSRAARSLFEVQLLHLFRGIDADAQHAILSTMHAMNRDQDSSSVPSAANPRPGASPPPATPRRR